MGDEASNRKLMALLTGEMGESLTIAKVAADLGTVLSAFLPDMIESETGQKLTFSYAGCTSGLKADLIADLDEFMVLTDGALRNWSPDFTIACASPLIIGVVESLLGGALENIVESEARPASKIELQMGSLLMEKIALVIKSALEATGNFEPVLTKPYNAENRPTADETKVDAYATEIKMTAVYGTITSHFSLIVAQKALLKTRIKFPQSKAQSGKNTPSWAQDLADQVRRSDVRLEARIRLKPLSLGMVARLQPGDIIEFLDADEISVEVNANGREMYLCEFGRSGEQYTVRVKDTQGAEGDILKHLME